MPTGELVLKYTESRCPSAGKTYSKKKLGWPDGLGPAPGNEESTPELLATAGHLGHDIALGSEPVDPDLAG